MRRLFIFLFYCLFSLTVVLISLLYLFPREKLLSWTEQLIERKFPGVECRVGAVTYIHPLKVRLYEIVLRSRRYRFEIPVETLLISFEPRYPIEKIGAVGVLLGGAFKAEVMPAPDGVVKLGDLEFSAVHLGDFDKLEEIIGRPVEGLLSFDGRAEIDRNRPGSLRLSGSLEITDFRSRLRQPIFGEREVYFSRVSADISQSGARMELLRGRSAGPLISGSFYGEVRWDRPWEQSLLELTGNLTPQPGLLEKRPELAARLRAIHHQYGRQSLPCSVDGTITQPRFRFRDPN